MKKRNFIIFSAVVTALILGALFTFVPGESSPAFADAYIKSPYFQGFRYSGSGTVSIEIDTEKIKDLSGFPGGEEGLTFIDLLKESLEPMNMRFVLEGKGKEGKMLEALKIMPEGLPQYEIRYYSDGTAKWVYISRDGRDGAWMDISGTDSAGNIPSSIHIENLHNLKDSIVLESQDSDSSTFEVKVTDKIAEEVFGPQGMKSIEELSNDKDSRKFINNMNLVIRVKTLGRVDALTPYIKISNVQAFFDLPYNSIDALVNNSKTGELGPEEKKILNSILMKIALNIDYSYEDVEVERPPAA